VEAKSIKITGARIYCIYFCISRWHHCLSTVQMKPFQSQPNHSANDSHFFGFSLKNSSWSAFSRGPKKYLTETQTYSRHSCRSPESLHFVRWVYWFISISISTFF
jgi:hypothetical protein